MTGRGGVRTSEFQFQATHINAEDMIKELTLHHKSIRNRLLDRYGGPLSLDRIDFGAKFNYEINSFTASNKCSGEVMSQVQNIKQRCEDTLTEALNQVEKRLPETQSIFKGLSYLAPSYVLSQTMRVDLNMLPMQHLIKSEEYVIKEQYRKILRVSRDEESTFDRKVPKNSVEFWSRVIKFRNSIGEPQFYELATYALACLSTPVSNAVVERFFSTVTNVKTKMQNRLGSQMLDAIARIRVNLQFQENPKCCKDFYVSPEMTERFKTYIPS